jgi:hypothetical protein
LVGAARRSRRSEVLNDSMDLRHLLICGLYRQFRDSSADMRVDLRLADRSARQAHGARGRSAIVE